MAQEKLIFKIKADFLKSLAHPARLEIIEYLKTRESSVGEMVKKLGLEQAGILRPIADILRKKLAESGKVLAHLGRLPR